MFMDIDNSGIRVLCSRSVSLRELEKVISFSSLLVFDGRKKKISELPIFQHGPAIDPMMFAF